jgi:hypothetical protein
MSVTVTVVQPSREEAAVKEQALELLRAAAAVDLPLDPGGFVTAWLGDNVRVAVARDDGAPVGMGIMAFGRRWFDDEFSASITVLAGPARGDVLKYLWDAARMLGATRLYWAHEPGDPFDGVPTPQRMMELGA